MNTSAMSDREEIIKALCTVGHEIEDGRVTFFGRIGELADAVLAARSTPKHGEAMPRLEFIGLPPGEMVPFGSFDADGETPATVVFKLCPSPSVEPAPAPHFTEAGVPYPIPMDWLRSVFERANQDLSYGFKQSRAGNYKNPAISRDWKWFRAGVGAAQNYASPPPLQVEPGWQPIETAPKDGRWVLITNGDNVENCYWDEAMHRQFHWRNRGGNGWLASWPTHWMHLPPAPKEPKP